MRYVFFSFDIMTTFYCVKKRFHNEIIPQETQPSLVVAMNVVKTFVNKFIIIKISSYIFVNNIEND